MAAQQSPGAAKLCEICRTLYNTALKSIKARRNINSASSTSAKISAGAPGYSQGVNHPANHHAFEQRIPQDFTSDPHVAFASDANMHQTLTLPDNDLFGWFEDYMGCNTSMLDILESDQAQRNWDMANL